MAPYGSLSSTFRTFTFPGCILSCLQSKTDPSKVLFRFKQLMNIKVPTVDDDVSFRDDQIYTQCVFIEFSSLNIQSYKFTIVHNLSGHISRLIKTRPFKD